MRYYVVIVDEPSSKMIVPAHWIRFDDTIGKLVTKYLFPPYDNPEDEYLFNQLVSSYVKAPADWPEYPISICGDASKNYCNSFSSNIISCTTITIHFPQVLLRRLNQP